MTVTVEVPRISIRKQPSLLAEIVRIANYGDKLEKYHEEGDWIEVHGGYVMKEFVS